MKITKDDMPITENALKMVDDLRRNIMTAHLIIGLLVEKLNGKTELKIDDAADRLLDKYVIQTFDMQTGTVLLELIDKSTPEEIKK